MDSQNSQSVHTDESNRERNVSKAQILYPELSDEMLETMVIAVEFGIDCSEAESFRYAMNHPSEKLGMSFPCLGAEPSDVGVNGCFAIHQWHEKIGVNHTLSLSRMCGFVRTQLVDWGFDDDQIDSFIETIIHAEVVKGQQVRIMRYGYDSFIETIIHAEVVKA